MVRGIGRNAVACGLCAALAASAFAADTGIVVSQPGQGNTYQLVYKFTPGQFARYEVLQKSKIVSKYPQASETVDNESTTSKHYRVIASDAGGAQLEPIIDRVQMSVTFNAVEKREYDSAAAGDPPQGFGDVAANVGRALARVQLTSNGEMIKVTPLANAPKSLVAMAAQNDAKLNFLVPFPKEPVGVGAVWKDRYQTPVTVGQGLSQPVTLQREFELKSVSGSVATIAFKTVVLTPIGNPQVEAQLLQCRPAGTIEFDLERGLIVSQTTKASGDVVNPFGANTQLTATLESSERLLDPVAGVQPATLKQ